MTPRRALPCNFMLKNPPRAEQGLATSLVELLPLKLEGAAREVADVIVEIKSPET